MSPHTFKWRIEDGKLMLIRISISDGTIELFADGEWTPTDLLLPLSPGAQPWKGAPAAEDEHAAYAIMRRAGVPPEEAIPK